MNKKPIRHMFYCVNDCSKNDIIIINDDNFHSRFNIFYIAYVVVIVPILFEQLEVKLRTFLEMVNEPKSKVYKMRMDSL